MTTAAASAPDESRWALQLPNEPEVAAGPHVIQRWDGRLTRLLRQSMRLSVRDFAAKLGVSHTIVSEWEAAGAGIMPRAFTQALLDEAYRRADDEDRQRFAEGLAQSDDERRVQQTPRLELGLDCGPEARQLVLTAFDVLGSHGITASETCTACGTTWPCADLRHASRIIVNACGSWAQ